MGDRLTDKEVVKRALHDAIDWNEELLDAIRNTNDPYEGEVRHRLKRTREVLEKYFGPRPDPFKNVGLVSLEELQRKGDTHTFDDSGKLVKIKKDEPDEG